MVRKKHLCFVAAVIGFLLCQCNAVYGQSAKPNPQVILRRAVVRYASMSSYQDSGTVRILSGDLALSGRPSPPLFQSVSANDETLVYFKTYFRRPRMFRFEWRNSLLRVPRNSVIWSDRKQAYRWASDGTLGKAGFLLENGPDLSSYIESAVESSSGAVFLVPSLLMKDVSPYTFADVLSNMTELSLLTEEQVDGEMCFVIKGNTSTAPWVLWVGKKSHLLRKTRTLYSGGSFHEKVEKGIVKTLIAEETHLDIKINKKIPEDVFKFTPQMQLHDVDLR